MPRYAALLRGVMPTNCKMPALKDALEKAGFTGVKTVISSGNAVFSARSASESALEKKCEAAMEKHMGREFMTIVRPIDELAALLEADPFRKFDVPANGKRNVTFLRAEPAEKPKLPIDLRGARILALEGREAFTYYIPQVADPAFMTLIEKTFGKAVTTRTWETVGRIVKAGMLSALLLSCLAEPMSAQSATRAPKVERRDTSALARPKALRPPIVLRRDTTIVYAARLRDSAQVAALLSAGVDPETRVPGSDQTCDANAMRVAVDSGSEPVVRALLAAGANVNVKDSCGSTPVGIATWRGNESMVRLLLAHGAAVGARQGTGTYWTTSLHGAAGSGNESIVRLLLDHRANVNTRDITGATPLHLAVSRGHEGVTRLLLERGATVSLRDYSGLAAIHLYNGCRADDRQGTSEKCEGPVRALLAAGADARSVSKQQGNTTPLHSAAGWDLVVVARLLLDAGADVNARTMVGGIWHRGGDMTPLHNAMCFGSPELIELLLDRGADINARVARGWTPLDLAKASSERLREKRVALLVGRGARENVPAPGACQIGG